MDSGGPLEFVLSGETGFVAEASAAGMAEAMDRLWENRACAQRLGQAARDRYAGLNISWQTVIDRLLA
jgi:glycosyltransferase involved in cell wall biosynthesis